MDDLAQDELKLITDEKNNLLHQVEVLMHTTRILAQKLVGPGNNWEAVRSAAQIMAQEEWNEASEDYKRSDT